MSSWSGKSFGNVTIGELIARGGMAEVYRGIHTMLRRDVAVKIMRDHVEDDPETRARFEREARAIAKLEHPNIIRIHDYNLLDGRPCLVMDLVEGASLGNYLKAIQKRGEKLPHETIARLLASIAAAIDHAHQKNVVHRDIKPGNILLRASTGSINASEPLPGDVEPVLTDFGLVRLLDSQTQTSTGTVSGTPAYMSPEQARGEKVDHRTDIYSLGVVLYEMLAGNVPFDAESSFGVLMKHLSEPPPPIEGISPSLQAVINRALSKDPARRFPSASALAKEFQTALVSGEVSAETQKLGRVESESVEVPQNTPISKLRIVWGGFAFIILSAFLFGVWLWLRPAEKPAPLAPDQIVGQVTFFDFNLPMDEVVVTINGLPPPGGESHYEAWFLSQGGEMRRNLGSISFTGESGSLTYIDPEGQNLLSLFDRVEITREPDLDSNPDESSGDVIASSLFPPETLNHVRHVLVAVGSTPGGTAFVQGLWYGADSIDTSAVELRKAFDNGDEATLRLKTEEIINQLSGSKNKDLYKDWNGDGQITDPVEGYGMLSNGTLGSDSAQGYLPQTLRNTQLAADAPDATKAISKVNIQLEACIANMENWGSQLLDQALKLNGLPFGPGMESKIANMQALSSLLLYGEDVNKNGRIEPIPGECGADTIYEISYLLAQMPLLSGAERIPLPGK